MIDTCPECGSKKIVPDVPLLDHYGEYGGFSDAAKVEVHGDPNAWFFKETATGKVTADICGDCGHAELRVSNFRELYEKYCKAQETAS
jgi:hypothetical protein